MAASRRSMGRRRRLRIAARVGLLAGVTLPVISLGAGTAADAAAPTVCSSTGGDLSSEETIGGTKYIVVTFNTSGVFTPAQSTDIEYLLVAGGGGGGRGNQNVAGGGGGAGGVRINVGSPVTVSSAQTITIGSGGTGAATAGTIGGDGTATSAGAIVAAGGGGGGSSGNNAVGNGAAGGSGGGGSNRAAALTGGAGTVGQGSDGGDGRSAATTSGGGGGGYGGVGADGADAAGGNGGAGLTTTDFGASISVAGGGGGSSITTGGTGGTGGGGDGGHDPSGSRPGVDGTANTGGGGGAGYRQAGGDGGSGVAVIRYRKYCLNPSAPTSASLSAPTFSWSAPAYIPPSQSLTSYTVTYTDSTNLTSSGSIYARGSTATSLNISGLTEAACTSNNPGWTCVLGGGDLLSGHTYEFRVFARTASTLGQMTSSFDYVVP